MIVKYLFGDHRAGSLSATAEGARLRACPRALQCNGVTASTLKGATAEKRLHSVALPLATPGFATGQGLLCNPDLKERRQMANEEMPRRVTPRLWNAPRPREIYWCDFPEDAQLPEFWKCRPVIVVSANHRNSLHGVVIVVPCTTLPPRPEDVEWSVKLAGTVDGKPGASSWAVCQPTSVAVSRLKPPNKGNKTKVSSEDFTQILAKVLQCFPPLKT